MTSATLGGSDSGDSLNPYRAPGDDSQRAIRDAVDDALKNCEHVSFAGQINREDVRAAVRESSMRSDLKRLRRSRWLILVPGIMLLLLFSLRWMRGAPFGDSSLVMTIGLAVLLGYLYWMDHWLVARHVKFNSDLIGPVRGRIDRDALWIEDEHQVRYRPLSALVGSELIRRGWVLCFDATHSLFEMIETSSFDDPDAAQLLATSVSKERPFKAMVPLDKRRFATPTDPPQFVPGSDAQFYSGELLKVDIVGTPLARLHRRDQLSIFLRLGLTFLALSIFIAVIDVSPVVTLLAIGILALTCIWVILRSFRMASAGQENRDVLWRSAGWIDGDGSVSMTSIGQTRSSWSAFDQAAVTDRAITLRTRSGALWYLIGRQQFQDEGQWEAACRMVRDRLPSTS